MHFVDVGRVDSCQRQREILKCCAHKQLTAKASWLKLLLLQVGAGQQCFAVADIEGKRDE